MIDAVYPLAPLCRDPLLDVKESGRKTNTEVTIRFFEGRDNVVLYFLYATVPDVSVAPEICHAEQWSDQQDLWRLQDGLLRCRNCHHRWSAIS